MERLYRWLTDHKSNCNQIILAYVLATVTNVLSERKFSTIVDYFSEFKTNNFSIIIMWIGLALVIAMNIFYHFEGQHVIKMQESYKLKNIILQNSDPIYRGIAEVSGYSWGTNRTLLCCDNIIQGWEPEQFVVEKLNVSPMPFTQQKLNALYQSYVAGAAARDIIEHGNNNSRWMIEGIQPNFNKTEKKIYLQLRETDYCTTSCVWQAWAKDDPAIEKKQRLKDTFGAQKKEYLPHSLCLHLAIVTADKQVVVTLISRFKKNDYAFTKAVTLGEQIESTDFENQTSFHDDFIERWIKRALSEEFGIDEKQYHTITGKNAIHVLALDFEGDIYNFSFMVVLDLKVKYEVFKDEVYRNPARDKEYDRMEGMPLEKIPEELKRWEKKEERTQYHPSSYLRMYLTYIHYYGIKNFIKAYEEAVKKELNV